MAHAELIWRIIEEVTGLEAKDEADARALDALDLCLVILNIEEALDILIENEKDIRTLADLFAHVQNAVA